MTDDTLSTPGQTDTDDFGSNTWLVDQMYRRYQQSADSVSDSWREFFADYQPDDSIEAADGDAAVAVTVVGDGGPPAIAESQTAAEETPEAPPARDVKAVPDSGLQTETGDAEAAEEPELAEGEEATPLRGGAAIIVERMEESRDIPTATSFRTFPAKLLEVNRMILNNQLKRLSEKGKVSFTHIIGWAVVRALMERPAMSASYRTIGGKPHRVQPQHLNLGLAMDVERKDGSRTLLVPNIKGVDTMTFREYWDAYEDIVGRARTGKITPDDFAGTTATLTNPGTVGTVQSVPRLMPGQGVIVGVGRIGYPPEYEGADPKMLASTGVGRAMTMTSTYDHRIIQGAESGLFLRRIHDLLLGVDGFYDDIFESMQIPYVPARWAADSNPPPGSRAWAEKQATIFQLINIYRARGHLIADLDPLRQNPPAIYSELDPLTYGLTLWDLDREYATGGLAGKTRMRLGRILGVLRDAYCRTVGIEYMHIQEPDQKLWIQEHAESVPPIPSSEEKLRIMEKLNQAEAFERFLHTKFLGAKRFSLEGSESLIPLVDTIITSAADAGMTEVTLGMAHRGRLNVLANIVNKELATIFREFAGEDASGEDTQFSGDVKYHMGAVGTHTSSSGNEIRVEAAANPSHLEAIDPVLVGIARARQDALGEGAEDLVLPLLIHGDAAFSGQGVVAETLNLSQLNGYYTGGTVHVVVNNQVGFTTGSKDARSSLYATDIAKGVQAPIFHVNADDPEAVGRVGRLAFAFRQTFHKDVVVDLVCYRRLGHNEGDEPTYTQPRMYRIIDNHESTRALYADMLVKRGDTTSEEIEAQAAANRQLLVSAFEESRRAGPVEPWETRPSSDTLVDTTVPLDQLTSMASSLAALPDGFAVHPKLAKQLTDRHELFQNGHVDWALAEALAFGSLALQGHRVRLVGEDSQRGTFSHRHAVLVDYETEDEYTPLQRLGSDQAQISIYDSMLSEFAAMGFEYGYSVAAPDDLVLWEAQFGDFVNGAQVVIDQFLTPGLDKWDQTASLVLLLPHGFEGQGPEHSSARLERFLTNAAEDNVRVAVPSTPAQYFHLLRRQALHAEKRPLIVMSPKSLLRTRATFSPLADLHKNGLHKVIADATIESGARRVVMCSGKVFYDLARYRQQENVRDVAVVRVEQLYPFPAEDITRVLDPHEDAEIVWVQEEPANMGAWRFMSRYLFVEAGRSSRGIYRTESSSPATGSSKTHAREQQELVAEAFAS